MAERVHIVEVSPRDGLQNEEKIVATADKLRLINLLTKAGLPTIEITSCVPAKWVPQLADHNEVIQKTTPIEQVTYPVLVPNLHGMKDALGAGASSLSVISSASELFSQKNSNCSIEQGLERVAEIITITASQSIPVRGYISCTLGCPFGEKVSSARVVQVAETLFELGLKEIVLSDTIGVGTPNRVQDLLQDVLQSVPPAHLAVHFHDTYGQALANIYSALEYGIRIVDSSVAGLGGCPYAQGASGNVATEDLVYLLDGLGMGTGVDLDKLIKAGEFICSLLGKENGSKVAKAIVKRGDRNSS